MPTLIKRPIPVSCSLESYVSLRDRVKKTLLEGQQKIEQQRVITYWESGKHIHEHLFLREDRGEYGKDVIERLADDLKISERLLYQCLQSYRAFKNLHARANSSLTWAHLRATMRIPDEKKRLKLLEQASKDEWTSRELEIKVRNYNWSKSLAESESKKPAQLPAVTLGSFHTYQIIRPSGVHGEKRELLLDLGFSMKKEMNLFREKFPAGTFVTSVKDGRGYSLKKVSVAEDLLYTYKAYVVDVIDGDTLKVDFRLGFGDRRGETLRLNSIDCPEINTPEGKAARRFVESQLSACDFITVKSIRTRKEKWGRYLGDVFYIKKGIATPVYLNQLLLDKGHAVRVRV